MKYKDLENKSVEDLRHILEEAKAAMLQLQFDLANKKLSDVSKLKKNKIDIARILTKIKEYGSR